MPRKDPTLLDKLDRADVPVALASVTYPVWAQMLAFWLQVALGLLGLVYLLMRMHRERLLIKIAASHAAAVENADDDE